MFENHHRNKSSNKFFIFIYREPTSSPDWEIVCGSHWHKWHGLVNIGKCDTKHIMIWKWWKESFPGVWQRQSTSMSSDMKPLKFWTVKFQTCQCSQSTHCKMNTFQKTTQLSKTKQMDCGMLWKAFPSDLCTMWSKFIRRNQPSMLIWATILRINSKYFCEKQSYFLSFLHWKIYQGDLI